MALGDLHLAEDPRGVLLAGELETLDDLVGQGALLVGARVAMARRQLGRLLGDHPGLRRRQQPLALQDLGHQLGSQVHGAQSSNPRTARIVAPHMTVTFLAAVLSIGCAIAFSVADLLRKLLAERVRPLPLLVAMSAGMAPFFLVWWIWQGGGGPAAGLLAAGLGFGGCSTWSPTWRFSRRCGSRRSA